MSPIEAVTVIAASAAAVASIAASIIGVINAWNGGKTHALVNGLSARATQLERQDAASTGYVAGARAEAERQRSAPPPT